MIFALLGALAIGISLGLLGSGGSILTVPVLVYALHRPEKIAIAESLAIVGSIAAVSAIPYALRREVRWRRVAWFGGAGIIGAYFGAALSHPVSGAIQLAVFALVMLVAAAFMIRAPQARADAAPVDVSQPPRIRPPGWIVALHGLIVGLITGFVGVGGGFLIVPALVLLGGLDMRRAIGTSLCIIAINAAMGFAKQLDGLTKLELPVDWKIIGIFIAVGSVGSFAGNFLGSRINQRLLRRAFGVFLIVMGAYILARQLRTLG
jgi:uncharacterized protein